MATDTNWRDVRADFGDSSRSASVAMQGFSNAGDIFTKMAGQLAARDQAKADLALRERAFDENVRQFGITSDLDRAKFDEDIRQFNEGDKNSDLTRDQDYRLRMLGIVEDSFAKDQAESPTRLDKAVWLQNNPQFQGIASLYDFGSAPAQPSAVPTPQDTSMVDTTMGQVVDPLRPVVSEQNEPEMASLIADRDYYLQEAAKYDMIPEVAQDYSERARALDDQINSLAVPTETNSPLATTVPATTTTSPVPATTASTNKSLAPSDVTSIQKAYTDLDTGITDSFLASIGASDVSQLSKSGSDQYKTYMEKQRPVIQRQFRDQWANARSKELALGMTDTGGYDIKGIDDATYNQLMTEGKQLFGKDFDITDTMAEGLHNAYLEDRKVIDGQKDTYRALNKSNSEFDGRVAEGHLDSVNATTANMARDFQKIAGIGNKDYDVWQGILKDSILEIIGRQGSQMNRNFLGGGIEAEGFGPNAKVETNLFFDDALDTAMDRLKDDINSGNVSAATFGDDKAGEILQMAWTKAVELNLVKKSVLQEYDKRSVAAERTRQQSLQPVARANTAAQDAAKREQAMNAALSLGTRPGVL